MTDTFLVDEEGQFVVGKAQTTPDDESIGFLNSAVDALRYWDMEIHEAFGHLRSGIYSGTAMLNRVLERKGPNVGIIVTAGMEDYLRLERGHSDLPRLFLLRPAARGDAPSQPAAGAAQADHGRARARQHLWCDGHSAVRTRSTRRRRALLTLNVEAIVVNLLYSYRNPAHELRIGQIAGEVMAEVGRELPIYLSSQSVPASGGLSLGSTPRCWKPTQPNRRANTCGE